MTMAPERIPDVQTTDAKPGKILRCPTEGCGKIFRSSPGYRYHLKSHDIDPRPHVCQCCHKKFKSANGLKYHLRKAHQIEPVLSKQNLGGTSPKSRESISSEEDPYISLNDSYPRNFLNGNGIPSPLVKSPLGLTSPLLKNLPSIPSPLIKSPMDMGPYLSGGSTGSSLQSPYINKDRYSNFYHKLNGENSHRSGNHSRSKVNTDMPRHSGADYTLYPSVRSSLSEYTQQCQQANNEFTQQIQRLSTGDVPTSRLSTSDYMQSQARSSCQYYNCHKTDNYSGSFSSDYHRNSIDSNYQCISSDKLMNSVKRENNNNNNNNNNSSCNLKTQGAFNTQISELTRFKIPVSTQNSEQIVPDISSPFCASPTEVSCDKNNNNTRALKSLRGASESSNETEMSDCVFQNENSMSATSPTSATEMITLSSTFKKEPIESSSCSQSNGQQHAKPLLSRRTSRTKSIPPALVINPSPTLPADLKSKDLSKLDPASRLRYLAEVATSPRSPFHQSPLPLPLTLTPSLLPGEGTPDWIKSPSKFSFLDKPSFLLTPTVSRSNPETSHTESLITSNNSLPASPFLDSIQTPSFWPTQIWPTPVWLCFLKGCSVKFEQDDKEFMTTEDVAAFCTTPGGRRRDDMNFYTSGMKVVTIREKLSLHSSRDMVELIFEQIIPGTQRLVAKAPIDHPFYVKHKGWTAFNQAEAMARYGIPFRSLQKNDTVVMAPSSKTSHTPCNTLSPCVTTNGPQVFTFSVSDTSKFSLSKKPGFMSPPPPAVRDDKPTPTTGSSTSAANETKPHDTIVLTYSIPSSSSSADSPAKTSSQQRLVNELKSISEAMKSKAAKEVSEKEQADVAGAATTTSHNLDDVDGKKNGSLPRKKRRKPLVGNEKDRRPMNGFMLFAKEMRVTLTKLFPGKDNRAISKLLGERWKELSEDKREDYSRSAKEMADERMKLNPDCWKRKHRKEKDAGSKSSSGENESPDFKKQKLQTPDKELVLTSEFAESHTSIEPNDQNNKT